MEDNYEIVDLVQPMIDVDPAGRVVIFVLPDKLSYYFSNARDAVSFAIGGRRDTHHYMGVTTQPDPGTDPGKPVSHRGSASTARAMGFVWADIDIMGPAHKKGNLPRTMEDAIGIIRKIGFSPTLLVHTGHGLQAYWKLSEPILIADEPARVSAKTLARRFDETVAQIAKSLGFECDSVGDLARVMRVPWSWNPKLDPSNPEQVRVLGYDPSLVYHTMQIESILVEDITQTIVPDGTPMPSIVFNAEPNIERGKLDAMKTLDVRFRDSWARRRNDIDSSPSGYHMSIASLLAVNGWSDQEIADALVLWNKTHNLALDKLMRTDYMERTIRKARINASQMSAQTDIITTPDPQPGQFSAEGTAAREEILNILSNLFGVRVMKVIKHGTEDSIYHIIIMVGDKEYDMRIGKADDLRRQDRLLNLLMDAVGVYHPRMKPAVWDSVMTRIMAVADTETIEGYSGYRTIMQDVIEHYLSRRSIITDETKAKDKLVPVIHNGNLMINANDLRSFIAVHHQHICSSIKSMPDMFDVLKRIGFKSTQIRYGPGKARAVRRYWVISVDDAIGMIPEKTMDWIRGPEGRMAQGGVYEDDE